jgi:brefeldin A-inhibited guanine nucleotide-exchange protein
MSKEDFIKNNRGINEGQDLPPEFLTSIYDDIYAEEIRMKDEIETSMLLSLPNQSSGIAGALANVGRDLQKEAYVMQSTGMAHKTEVRVSILSFPLRELTVGAGALQNDDESAAEGEVY